MRVAAFKGKIGVILLSGVPCQKLTHQHTVSYTYASMGICTYI